MTEYEAHTESARQTKWNTFRENTKQNDDKIRQSYIFIITQID